MISEPYRLSFCWGDAGQETPAAAFLPQLQELLMLRKLPRPLGQNSFICTLPGSDRDLIDPHLKPVTLTAAEALEQANTRVIRSISSSLVSDRR